MPMNIEKSDLELAKARLTEKNLSIVFVKNGIVIFETETHGIFGFLDAIARLEKRLTGATVADKVIGVAAARLCIHAGVKSVFALTISEGGLKLLEEHGIPVCFKRKVANILNRQKTDVCPFEKLAISSIDPEDAYFNLKSLAEQMLEKQKSKC